MRKLPLKDKLIFIDTPTLTEDCPDDECPEYIP